MATDLYLRNPHGYGEILEKLAYPQIAWTDLFLRHRKMSADAWHSLRMPEGQPFRALIIDVGETLELDQNHNTNNPLAIHPTWVHGQHESRLEAMLREQLPLVAVCGIPPYRGPFVRFYDWLSDMQAQFPETKIHLHGGHSFSVMFGLGFKSADYDPLPSLRYFRPVLPCGRHMASQDEWAAWGKWFRLVGFDWRKITSRAELLEFNVVSAYWAADHYNEAINFRLKRTGNKGLGLNQFRNEIPEAGKFLDPRHNKESIEGMDKIICDACSLAPHCKLYREGAVCTLNEAPTNELAKLFTTRDSNKIIEGIGRLVAMNVERLQEGRSHETQNEDGLDPEVTKLISHLIDQGSKLAKLVNPALVNPKFQVSVGILQQAQGMPAHQLAAVAIAQLEQRGYKREDITEAMVWDLIRGELEPAAAIEVSGTAEDEDGKED